ncbi:hypothetical protein ACLOJK_008952 [Asimina triloba]
MEKDKSPSHGGGLPPPHSGRYSPFPSPANAFSLKSEPSPSAPSAASSATSSDHGRFSHDISRMPDFPPKNRGHRRAHSEILGLPDDISFDSDLGVVGSAECPSLSVSDETEEDLVSMFIDMDKFSSSCATSGLQADETPAATATGEKTSAGSGERPRIRHQHSQSMDGSTSIKPELLVSGSEGPCLAETKKAISASKLADLALIDPKRAKRFGFASINFISVLFREGFLALI